MRVIHYATVAVLASSALSACATKGFVRRGLEDQRAMLSTAQLQSAMQERAERTAADSALHTDVNAVKSELLSLRTDLQGLKTEFGARITAVEGQITFALPVHFGFDDAAVRQTDRAALDRFVAVARSHYAGATITVEGFADPAGSASYNLKLSQARADSVKAFLVANGLDAAFVKTIGYGKTRLVTPGAQRDANGAELNRRVTFVVDAPAQNTIVVLGSR